MNTKKSELTLDRMIGAVDRIIKSLEQTEKVSKVLREFEELDGGACSVFPQEGQAKCKSIYAYLRIRAGRDQKQAYQKSIRLVSRSYQEHTKVLKGIEKLVSDIQRKA